METSLHAFPDRGEIPNHPRLPAILYRGVLPPDESDLATAFEHLFASHGWAGLWRNGIYPFHHFHSTAHEVLGIANGTVTVELGGEGGLVAELTAGDAVLLPAGTGHKRLQSSADLLVIGGYPAGQSADLIRATGTDARDQAIRQRIAAVGLPAQDPVGGLDGVMVDAWVSKRD